MLRMTNLDRALLRATAAQGLQPAHVRSTARGAAAWIMDTSRGAFDRAEAWVSLGSPRALTDKGRPAQPSW